MKKIKYIFLTMLFIICLCTGCGSKKEDVEVKNIEEKEEVLEKDISKKLTFICDNNKIKVETPNSWSEYKEEKMNDDACLELIGADEIKYLIVISEEKSSFSSFNYWFDTVYSNVKESYQLDDSKIRRSDEGGLNTRFIENELEMNGEKVYLPSPNLHALFLLRHMVSHFAASEINFRQVLDWAFFVEKHTKEVDWKWLLNLLDEYHMRDFCNCINAICVEDLGFDSKIFPEVQSLPELKERVLEDILDPEYGNSGPKKLIPRLAYKIKRWQGNAWKQKLCYSESRWSAFWSGVWAKMLKPASI